MYNTHSNKSLSGKVTNLLILFGLIAEACAFAGIFLELAEKQIIISTFGKFATIIAIVFMLIHHYYIIKNFHIIDNLNEMQLIENGLGVWVMKSIIEGLIRLFIFILFSIITGEILYLVIVGTKDVDLFFGSYYNGNTNHPREYNLDWITKTYIICSIVLSLVTILWELGGKLYDSHLYPVSKIIKNINNNGDFILSESQYSNKIK